MPRSKPKSNRAELIGLMSDHQLSPSDVGKMLNREAGTVLAYRSVAGVDIPDHSLELLKYKIGLNK